jgi:hypothetical protein
MKRINSSANALQVLTVGKVEEVVQRRRRPYYLQNLVMNLAALHFNFYENRK